jgi:hypothetical protein
MTRSEVTLVIAALLAGACGGSLAPVDLDASTDGATGADATKPDGGTGTDASQPPPIDAGSYDFCKESAARASKCGDGFDPTACAQQASCFAGAMRPQSALNVEQCFTSSPCGTISDKCIAIEESKFQGDPAVQKYYADCNAKSAACGGQPTKDTCNTYGVLNDSARALLTTCMTVACGAVGNCIDNAGKSLGCK